MTEPTPTLPAVEVLLKQAKRALLAELLPDLKGPTEGHDHAVQS